MNLYLLIALELLSVAVLHCFRRKLQYFQQPYYHCAPLLCCHSRSPHHPSIMCAFVVYLILFRSPTS